MHLMHCPKLFSIPSGNGSRHPAQVLRLGLARLFLRAIISSLIACCVLAALAGNVLYHPSPEPRKHRATSTPWLRRICRRCREVGSAGG